MYHGTAKRQEKFPEFFAEVHPEMRGDRRKPRACYDLFKGRDGKGKTQLAGLEPATSASRSAGSPRRRMINCLLEVPPASSAGSTGRGGVATPHDQTNPAHRRPTGWPMRTKQYWERDHQRRARARPGTARAEAPAAQFHECLTPRPPRQRVMDASADGTARTRAAGSRS